MPKKPKYTNQQVEKAVKNSTSIRQVLIKLGLVPAGGNYESIKNLISSLNLDTSHFLGQAIHKGKKFGPKRPIEDYLSNSKPIQSYKLKNRLISEGYFDCICDSCRKTQWMGKPIPLELDHIDGNHQNNNLNNLRLLCPNCHAFTSTYRGKNKSKA